MKSRRRAQVLLIGVAFALILALTWSPLGTNLWLSLKEREYRVPAESSWFDFTPLVMNPGSGDWWIYGKDRRNYYHSLGDHEGSYDVISRREASACPHFDPVEIATWCRYDTRTSRHGR